MVFASTQMTAASTASAKVTTTNRNGGREGSESVALRDGHGVYCDVISSGGCGGVLVRLYRML
jgi:hypothetical protein